jgi:ketosteroid isomerase-like protein
MKKEFRAMPSKSTAELVEKMLRALELRPDELGPLLTDDARWWYPKSAVEKGFLESSCAEGREAILHGIRVAGYKRMELTLLHLIEEGDMVSVHVHGEGETLAGRDYSNDYSFLLRLVDGKIAEGWEYVDTAYVFARFNLDA